MNKKSLIKEASAKSGMTRIEVGNALSAITETILEALSKEEAVTLLGFGKFSIKARAARKGINPMTQTPIDIPASKIIQFRATKK